jgi:hypothetical protein
VLAIHVSNRFLHLGAVVGRTAAALGRSAVLITNGDDDAQDVFSSDWVLVSSDRARLARLAHGRDAQVVTGHGLRPWTDDYSNLLEAL